MRIKKTASYKDVGINLRKVGNYHAAIGRLITSTQSYAPGAKVLSIGGHYAGLVEIASKVFAFHSDGVGTKVLIAQLMDRFDTIGIDCIAMNVNDIVCVGARPIAFVDYIALKSSNSDIVKEIVKGLVKGAKIASVSIVGGETAILPDIIAGHDKNKAFDLAGTIWGIVGSKKRVILGKKIQVNDVILGVESSGLHSNGYSLARKILLSKYPINFQPRYLSKPLGQEMLVPTRIYVKPVVEILEKENSIPIHGLAHITGGAFTKLLRLNNRVRYNLRNLPSIGGIFKQIAVDGPVSLKEMYRTFNMGVGFCVIAPRESVDRICKIFRKYQMPCKEIGIVDDRGRGEVTAVLGQKQHTLSN